MGQFTYLAADLILLVAWLLLFLNKPYRREMLVMSLFFAPFAFLDFWFLQDYWSPRTLFGTAFGLETFLFAFLVGGIGAVIYEEFRGLKLVRTKREPSWILTGSSLLLLFDFLILRVFIGINSMYAVYVVFIFCAIFMYTVRRDQAVNLLASGLLSGIVGFFLYLIYLYFYPDVIRVWWRLENLSGILIAGIPLEELLFAFGFGMVAGPLYEVWQGYRLAKR